MDYFKAALNQRINYKSGFDIAVAYEGELRNGKPYCRLSHCLKYGINPNAANEVYSIDRGYYSTRTTCKRKFKHSVNDEIQEILREIGLEV